MKLFCDPGDGTRFASLTIGGSRKNLSKRKGSASWKRLGIPDSEGHALSKVSNSDFLQEKIRTQTPLTTTENRTSDCERASYLDWRENGAKNATNPPKNTRRKTSFSRTAGRIRTKFGSGAVSGENQNALGRKWPMVSRLTTRWPVKYIENDWAGSGENW